MHQVLELQDRISHLEKRFDEDEDFAHQENFLEEVGAIPGLFHRIHQLEKDFGYVRKVPNYAVDITGCTQSSFEKAAIRSGDRLNRIADWVRNDLQRRLRRATMMSVRPRVLKQPQTLTIARRPGRRPAICELPTMSAPSVLNANRSASASRHRGRPNPAE